MADLNCDVAVIGAGTAGFAAERAARRAGARTLLIDPTFAGTTCARDGCMPSKLLIAAGKAAYAIEQAGTFGVRASAQVDGRAVMARVRMLRDDFVASVVDGLADLPDGVAIRGSARFTGPTTLALDDGRCICANAVVIATGSRPAVPKPFDAVRDRILTNETIFDLPDLPRSLAVIGAGPLGLELAQACARLGVAVALFDQGTTLAGLGDEPAIAACLRAVLDRDMAIRLGVTLRAAPDGDGVRLSWEGGSEQFNAVLVATGRPPALDALDLAAAGLALDDRGVPVFDGATMRCGESAVFLAGDASGARAVLHEASREGSLAGLNAACLPRALPGRRATRFAIMFTDPGLAVIGDTSQADAVIGEASFADQGRARIMATNLGLARLYAARADGRLIGATVLAPAAEHLGHLLMLAIEQRLTATAMLDLPLYHPTYEEGLKPALRQICAATGSTAPADRDEGGPAGG